MGDDETAPGGHDDRLTVLETALKGLLAKVEELRADNRRLSAEVASLAAVDARLSGRLAEVAADHENLRTDVERLAGPDGDFTLLQKAVLRLEKGAEGLRRDVGTTGALDEAVEALREAVDRVEADNRRLLTDVATADQRMRRIQELLLEQRRTWAAEDQFGRVRLVEEFNAFVGQRLRGFADAWVPDGSADRPGQVAAVLAVLCEEFFLNPEPDPWAALGVQQPRWRHRLPFRQEGDPLATLLAEAWRLRERATELGLDWNFKYRAQVPLDPRTQEVWGTCDPQAPVAFVVIPSCGQGDELYRLQSVFTE